MVESQSNETKVVKSICGCPGHCECGVLVHVKNGRVIKIEGDPEHPQNEGALCAKGLAYTQILYHPDRIIYPMKRIGKKGEGKWGRISWDEAIDTIVSKIRQAKEEYGPESISYHYCDGDRHNARFGRALMYALGSPMLCGTDAHYCRRPQYVASMLTFGSGNAITYLNGPDYAHSKCILIWGASPFEARPAFGKDIIKGMKNGAKLIVVDPRFNNVASKADIWLQVRPGTDCALALGMLNYIIENELYDKEFVEKYCFGFEQLKERVKEYPVKKVSEITWVPGEDIRLAANLYATRKPGATHTFMGAAMHCNAMQALRAINLLPALTGNIDVKGGNLLNNPVDRGISLGYLDKICNLSAEEMAKAPGVDQWPLFYGHDALINSPSHPPAFYEMLLTGKPYQPRVVLNCCDPVMGLQDSIKNQKALMNVDFVVNFDYFLTPTANCADLLLPAATYLERDLVWNYQHYHNLFGVGGRVIEPVGECRDEADVILEIANRLGLETPFPVRNMKEFNDWELETTGFTFEDLRGKTVVEVPETYKRYEQEGYKFPTETGKIELYSKILEKYGYDPLPYYQEPPQSPYSTPELFEQYPLILISGARKVSFYHGWGSQIPWLRELLPDPIIEIHPDTAEKLGIHSGDWVWIETSQMEGRVKQKAELTLGIHRKVVSAQSHWRYPERKDDPGQGCMESNINTILSAEEPYDPISGSSVVRGALCKIYKVEED